MRKKIDCYHTGLEGEKSGFYFEVNEHLFDKQSPFQHIEVVETPEWGRVLLLDSEVMTTDWDGFIYPEMIVHPALVSHPSPQTVAIIGGGDGGAVTEACRHGDLKKVFLCEIDREVMVASREFFPKLSVGLDDVRSQCVYEEGGGWLATQPRVFDVIVVDGTDPVGPGVKLFEEEFYRLAANVLKPGGIYVQQIESPFYSIRSGVMPFDLTFEEIVTRAKSVFEQVKVYLATIPTYVGSYWAFLYAGDKNLPLEPRPERWEKIKGQTRYYSPEIQKAAFVLPPFVEGLFA